MMETIGGEQVATNPKTGAKVVFRGGSWVPYTPNLVEAGYEKYVANPLKTAIQYAVPPMTKAQVDDPTAPKSAGSGIANLVVPPNLKQAGIDAGMLAGTALAPEAVVPGILSRLALTAGGGALGSKLSGDSALRGAGEGMLQQGVGEVAAPLINAAGKYSAAALNKADVNRIGGLIHNVIPTSGLKGIKSVPGFDAAFRGGEAVEKTGADLADFEAKLAKKVGNAPLGSIKMPGPMMSSGERFMVDTPMTFQDMTDQIRDLNRKGYSYGGDAQQKALAADARRQAHDLTQTLGDKLNDFEPGLGTKYLAERRKFAGTALMSRIFSEPSIYSPNGRIDILKLQELVANTGQAGYREDLIRVLGRDKANQFLKAVYRGAPPTARDIEGKGVLGTLAQSMRTIIRPGSGVGEYMRLPSGGNVMGQQVGTLPRYFPKLPPAVPGLAAGAKLSDLINQLVNQNAQ